MRFKSSLYNQILNVLNVSHALIIGHYLNYWHIKT